MWSFQVAQGGGHGARAGYLRSTVGGIATPTCLVYTRRGTPLHLTRETLADLVRRARTAAGDEGADAAGTDLLPVGVHVHVDALLTAPVATAPLGAVPPALQYDGARWLGLQGAFVLATQRDPLAFDDDMGVTDKQGVLTTSRGRRKVTPAE